MKFQDEFVAAQSAVSHKDDTINSLTIKIEQLENKYTASVSKLAVLKARLKSAERKKTSKMVTEVV